MTDEIENQNEIPAWFIDDGLPGNGPRPTWLNEKFKTVADLGKSFNELEKKLGSPPDNYDFSKSKYLDPDYVPFQELQQIAKDKRVPQVVIDKMLDSVDRYMDEFNIDRAEEIKKLGDNAKDRLATLDSWAKVNLSQNSYDALTNNLKTADGIKALEELRGKMMSSNPQIPNGNDGNIDSPVNLDDLKLELSNNLEKYKTDPNYRKDIRARLEIAAKNAPGFQEKVGA